MALAGTKTTGSALTQPAAEEVVSGSKPPSPPFSEKLHSFWQTVKPFGWQGLLLVVVLGILYWPVLKLLVWQWYYDPDYGHAFLVPLLSAFLIYQRRGTLRTIERRPSPWGMVIVFGALGLLTLGSLGAELTLARLSISGHDLRADRLLRGRSDLAGNRFPDGVLAVCHSDPDGDLQRDRVPPAVCGVAIRDQGSGDAEPVPHHARGQCTGVARAAFGGGGSVQRYPFADVIACVSGRLRISC